MSPETVLALNEINRRFYRNHAGTFSATASMLEARFPVFAKIPCPIAPDAVETVLLEAAGTGSAGTGTTVSSR